MALGTPGDPPVRIDYVWSSSQPAACSLFTAKCTDGTSLSDHMGVEAAIELRSAAPQPAAPGKRPGRQLGGDTAPLQSAREVIQQGEAAQLLVCRLVMMPATRGGHSRQQPCQGHVQAIFLSMDILTLNEAICHGCRAGCRRCRAWKNGMLLAAFGCAVAGLVAMGFVLAGRWWRGFPSPLLPVLAVVQAVCLLLAPLLFVIGMAGYGSVGNALEQAANELQVVIKEDGPAVVSS